MSAIDEPLSAASSGIRPPSGHARVGRSILGAAGLIAVITLLARFAGFGRYLVFGVTIGGGDIGTAYASANFLPNILFEIVAGGALVGVVVPLVASALAEGRERDVNNIVSAILSWSLTALLPLTVLVLVLAGPIARIVLGSGTEAANPSQVQLGATLVRVFAIQLVLYGIGIVVGAYLQARRRFVWPAFVPLLSSVVVMLTYLLYAGAADGATRARTLSPDAVFWLGWGTTFGVAALSLPMLIPAFRAGLRLRPSWRFPAGIGVRARRLAVAGLGAVAAQQLANLVVLVLAMRAGGSSTITVFQYAQAVYLLPFAVLIVPVMTSIFPHLAALRGRGAERELSLAIAAGTRTVLALAAIGTAALWAAAPAIEMFFRGIDRDNVVGVGATVGALSIGLGGFALMMFAARVMYALERTGTAILIGSIGWAVAAALVALTTLASPTRAASHAAVTFGLSFAIGMVSAGVLALIRLDQTIAAHTLRTGLGRSTLVALLAAVLGAGIGYLLAKALTPGTAEIAASLGVGALAGLAASLVAAAVLLVGDRSVFTGLAAIAPDAPQRSGGSAQPGGDSGRALR